MRTPEQIANDNAWSTNPDPENWQQHVTTIEIKAIQDEAYNQALEDATKALIAASDVSGCLCNCCRQTRHNIRSVLRMIKK